MKREEKTIKNRKPNIDKMLAFGFKKCDTGYSYVHELLDGRMEISVIVSDGKVFTELVDVVAEEEYTLHLVPSAAGNFVGRVKAEYESVVEEIYTKCFDSSAFKSEQALCAINYIRETYGDELEYLWQKFPDNAIVRRRDNRKWYAAILTVSRKKLGFDSDERVEIIDLRASPEQIELIVDNSKYFPGYHMNKKHWFTVCFDGSVAIEEIFRKIDESYNLALR